jgi:hypothetical protein
VGPSLSAPSRFPARAIDEGEDPKAAMVLELYEETGYRYNASNPWVSVIQRRSNVLLYTQRGIEAAMDLEFVPRDSIEIILVTRREVRISQ